MTLSLPASGAFCVVSLFLHRFRDLTISVVDDLQSPSLTVDGPNSEEVSIGSYPVGNTLLISQHIHDISTAACRDKGVEKNSRVRFVTPSFLNIDIQIPPCEKIVIRSANALRENHRAKITISGTEHCRPDVLSDIAQSDCIFHKVGKVAGFMMDSTLTINDGVDQITHIPFSKSQFISSATMNNGKIRKGDIVLPSPPFP